MSVDFNDGLLHVLPVCLSLSSIFMSFIFSAPPTRRNRGAPIFGYKKFELILTRRAKAHSSSGSAENWGVHAKLIYKYQILYLDSITMVPRRHLVNDIDLWRSPKSPKKSIKPPILAFTVIEFGANREPEYNFLLVINSNLGSISHSYWDIATYWPKIANFAHPSHLAPAFGVTRPFELIEKPFGFWN